VDGWMDGWMEGWKEGWVDGCAPCVVVVSKTRRHHAHTPTFIGVLLRRLAILESRMACVWCVVVCRMMGSTVADDDYLLSHRHTPRPVRRAASMLLLYTNPLCFGCSARRAFIECVCWVNTEERGEVYPMMFDR
jgi:hypothetical protein